jgi:MOSC domain
VRSRGSRSFASRRQLVAVSCSRRPRALRCPSGFRQTPWSPATRRCGASGPWCVTAATRPRIGSVRCSARGFDWCLRAPTATVASTSATRRAVPADGFPLLVATTASLEDLSRRAGATFEMERFRPNIVLSGSAAWEEDDWETLEVGDLSLRLVKPCSRCAITLVDPNTGERGLEPLRTLATFRRGAHLGYPSADAAKTYFAWNLVANNARQS